MDNVIGKLKDFFSPHYNGEPFTPFSAIHIITLVLLTLINFLIIIFYRNKRSKEYKKYAGRKNTGAHAVAGPVDYTKMFRLFLAIFMILNEAVYTAWSIATGEWTLGYSLPLHLCDMAMFFSVIMLVTKNYFLYEITYFWGLGGSLQALVTPDLYPYSFPHFIYFNFFLAHGAVVTSVLFMTFVEGFKPSKKSIWKTVVFTNIYMAVIAVIDILTQGNYLFLRHKPNNPSIMDYLGPWPWYILGLEAIGIVVMFILYIPFLISSRKSRNSHKGHEKQIQHLEMRIEK